MQCPECSTHSSGAFCPECGTALKPARCSSCDAQPPAGARFCTQCGTRLGARRAGSERLAWVVAGAAVLALGGVLVWQSTRDAAPAVASTAGLPGAPAGAFGAPSAGPLTGTPREQADRLFNRIMQAMEQGDTAQARFFTPMATQAYEMAGELDADGLFHLSVVQTIGGDPASGRATADRALADAPDHLLALIAAAQAAEAAGDADAARAYYQHFLRVYDQESVRPLPEYQDHGNILPVYREQARSRV